MDGGFAGIPNPPPLTYSPIFVLPAQKAEAEAWLKANPIPILRLRGQTPAPPLVPGEHPSEITIPLPTVGRPYIRICFQGIQSADFANDGWKACLMVKEPIPGGDSPLLLMTNETVTFIPDPTYGWIHVADS